MLKVLVIDDEKLVRQMVIRCIDWEEIGLCIVGEASSARMGQELIDELEPDIVFMDVRMPSMDGLTCSRLVLEKHPHIKILILSGHDEFEYASEGIRIGVFDYLLKPVNAGELRNAAIKARDAILEECDHRKEFERFKEELEKHSNYIKDRQLSALVRSRTPQQYLESLSYFGVEIKNTVFQAALVEIKPKISSLYEEDKILLKMHAGKIIEDYYGDMPGVFVFDSGADWLILLNNESEAAVYEHARDLKQYLENNTEAQVCIGVGNVYTELDKIRESYREAKDALKCRFVSGEEMVICFRDIYPYYDTDSATGMSEDVIHELGNAIRISDVVKAGELLDETLDYLKKTGRERDKVLIFSVEILAEIMKVLSELKVNIQSELLNYPTVIEGVFSLNTFEEVRVYIKKIVQEACITIRAEMSDKEKNLVHKVKDYITDHYYQEDISLNLLAQQYYVNPSYLSRVFKEKTGTTFTGYLFEIRMKEAENLVLSTDLKAYEIAERVGISDSHYFSSCFKKYTGVSVAEYKKSKK
ncbi:response regulator [Blautia schinkii]|nr:response regulator [Blautia schinkii]